ncbi:PREDICTED: POOR HOMOLOGOUS SYNAPSIS 1 [Prunus dulcis]|uniref:PREDICTED: POOR HOMOLOGOUS SYNAPSIS 1 n=1 Tax=Prunus dulcis TaxID=3755 RepID=A0A5E4ECH8_PRUDU|nr:protein POOR HOMOLOGOUS SYNAPSIS 1-like isoform X1 [Prunus dulcis]KAI5352264.1 hypothetical protein L3X38_005155 [Prunus dulcis]VVA13354.1 PREDICTED: POOR HOMOLOGOUS SYNAPSIS 1 [Prunus dulcis]
MDPNQGGEKKQRRKRKSLKEMARSLAVVPCESVQSVQTKPTTATVSAVREQWEVHFALFFPYPPPPITPTCPDLVPLDPKYRRRRPLDRWISSCSLARLQLARDHSNSEVVLTVGFADKILEEHYVSKLHFIWPQVSCMSGFPARGTRAIFVSYRDCSEEIQKFGFRFLSLHEAEKFMNALKGICKEGMDTEPVNTDVGSQISSESELTSFNRPLNPACKDLTTMTPVQTYTPKISPSLLNNEAEQYSCTQEFTPIDNFQSNFAALPPSFTSFLSNCGPVVEQVVTQPTGSQEVDLKSQIARYMEDASFQDMLFQVEKVISEIGGDSML